ncbi:MATH and LRR domain-containing protein PFE0570w isoform X2 [Drosophila novamexicana]|nr:MATH and LRR domain-containing protein PFE0570w isoform X2 [Drosophila novamexicana]XP_030556592.1 MATH and LRR domain-containing protein PFE0570w isoform X2 [Drosophila novamexicana]XP_030556593.1 MATH and LRR domain-containing protein PFE0570w isoform X2 [Drosophila novamexicana]XP_030556594.1 MATH and LRR domain-containing protein PFE0570w isoform X2 [Drosophila novamexicana]XP_030556595.1 MATH and LRR domain-containing protein PFE0570w isoform X2 [Drosophila novamexicana]
MMHSNRGIDTSSDRFSSRTSVYNYPEHLNPFNDEDNHKRLRFWRLSKSNENSKQRSFSIGNLRDIWNFRSFNLKKKSSTLGIQKTSESPPVLRRSFGPNTPYFHPGEQIAGRHSMQNLNVPFSAASSKVNGNPYQRSTNFDRCSTPQPHHYQRIRSSYSSLSSTNPFESEVESDVNHSGCSTVGLRPKSYRKKKRKAPSVPTKNMVTDPLNDPEKNSIGSPHSPNMEAMDIKSLTSEIERFVHRDETSINKSLTSKSLLDSETAQSDAADISVLSITENANNNTSNEKTVFHAKEDSCEKITVPYKKNLKTCDVADISVLSITENANNNISEEIAVPNIESPKTCDAADISVLSIDENTNNNISIENNICHAKEDNSVEIAVPNIENPKTCDAADISVLSIDENTNNNISIENNICHAKEDNSVEIAVPNIENPKTCDANSSSMQATSRSYENNFSCLENKSYKNNNIVRSSEYFNKPLTIFEKSESDVHRSDKKSKTEKAKSVKEIIDSINRSQQLLKESAAKGTKVYSTSLYTKSNITPTDDHNKNNVTIDNSSFDNHLHLQQSDFHKNKINKIVFECRESSPTSSNLDWNPVPKPKRINSDLTIKDINDP